MIDMSAHSNWDGQKLQRIVESGNAKAVVRAAAYLNGVARRKVKRRKKKSSSPGSPPYAHSSIFKASILFNVNASKTTAVIGPERLGGTPKSVAMFGGSGGGAIRTNESGQPIPDILEHGGMSVGGPQPIWWNSIRSRLGRPSGGGESAVTRFFKSIGFGPAYWATSSGTLQRQNRSRKSVKDYRKSLSGGQKRLGWISKRYSPTKHRIVYLQNIRIDTIQQAVKVKNVVMELFGSPVKRAGLVAPRPLMGPTLSENHERISVFWRNLT